MVLSQKERTEMVATIDNIEIQAKTIERDGDQGTLHSRDITVLCQELKLELGYNKDSVLF